MLLTALTALLLATPPAPYHINYLFRSTDPASHTGQVTIQVGPGRDADSIRFQLPAWYPGRYAIYNFAANASEEQGLCGADTVAATKTDKTTWTVLCPRGKTVGMTYQVWWNDLNGSTSQIDSTHINLNPGSIFVYVLGHKRDPVAVRYEGPAGWKVLNGAVTGIADGDPQPGPDYKFPNYDIMIDCPTEISNRFTLDSFQIGQTHYRIMIHTDGDNPEVHRRLVGDVEKIARATAAMWGEQPMKSYTFMMHYLAGRGGDGMEHLTSTHLSRPQTLDSLADTNRYLNALSSVAHEFFHTWSMKRLRGKELGPWDYSRENYTKTLWIGEGITNYYGVRNLLRSGVWSQERYLDRVAAAVRQLQRSPGRHYMSAEESSLSAWLFDAVPLRQESPVRRTTISYYNKGELLGWLLDLDIRARTGGRKSLDDVMRLMWQRFWKAPRATYYLPGRGYTDADFLKAVNDISGADYTDFFRHYVSGVDELPYDQILAKVGLRLTESDGRYQLALDDQSPHADLGRAWLEGK